MRADGHQSPIQIRTLPNFATSAARAQEAIKTAQMMLVAAYPDLATDETAAPHAVIQILEAGRR